MNEEYLNPSIFGLKKSADSSVMQTYEKLWAAVGGNSGNLAFHYAIDKHLGGNIPVYPWQSEVIPKGVGVLPCANQLGRHCNMSAMYEWFKTNDIPIVAIGLGAQSRKVGDSYPFPSLLPGTEKWVRALAERGGDRRA